MGIWSCVGLRQESVQKSLSGEVGTNYCSQWGSKQSLRCKPNRRGFKVVEGGLALGTDHDTPVLNAKSGADIGILLFNWRWCSNVEVGLHKHVESIMLMSSVTVVFRVFPSPTRSQG